MFRPTAYFYLAVFTGFLLVIAFFQSAINDIASLTWGHINYFEQHGLFLLLGLAVFPRFTLFFSNIASGGVIWWFLWFVAPRFLIAILATFAYVSTNPLLVFFAWVLAFSLETGEKYVVYKQSRNTYHTYQHHHQHGQSDDAIEVDYTVKK